MRFGVEGIPILYNEGKTLPYFLIGTKKLAESFNFHTRSLYKYVNGSDMLGLWARHTCIKNLRGPCGNISLC